MFAVRCPYCSRNLELAEILAETTVRCPSCAHFFDADPPAAVAMPALREPQVPVTETRTATALAPPPTSAECPPVLTAPHCCQQCREPLPTATGKRRSTFVCPLCHRVTSVYAVLYHCLRCGALLESALNLGGTRTPCPVCREEVEVPLDLLSPLDGARAEHSFGISCPSCKHPLRCQREAAGTWAVCPCCRYPLRVPRGGTSLGGHLSWLTGDPRKTIEESTLTHCASCHEQIPKRVTRCPFCGSSPGDPGPLDEV